MRLEDLRALPFGVILDALVGARVDAERRSRLVPIKEAKVSYRAILDAENSGELPVYRIGKAAFVDEDELDDFIRRNGAASPAATAEQEPEPDEIGQIIALQRRRSG